MSTESHGISHSGTAFAAHRSGSARFSRPMQLDQALLDHMAGGADPEELRELAHSTAASLLDRVHHTQDAEIVQRVIAVVDTEGIETIAQLWASSDAQSLPGILWRLYTMRTWMQRNQQSLAQLWREGELPPTAASAITGINLQPEPQDIASTADSILSGAFTGDFAVALDRASSFCHVVARALVERAKKIPAGAHRQAIAQNAQRLVTTAKDFALGAQLWRNGELH
ncbi:thymidine phosphorylase [Alloscardovia theropitheci]|uniref:Thymidine phosphorylase n=1 Tax=Alloscardovia theropitheci TaxID=2496842 RepID=A0A4R0QSU0_9BIFI|nr:thymidine phosphorylase [Alloscardovia theropitheci]TCD54548.1 thymidine phosphorylase [Alloscardovia theropitheci]